METSLKTGFAQISRCQKLPKKSELPKISRGLQLRGLVCDAIISLSYLPKRITRLDERFSAFTW